MGSPDHYTYFPLLHTKPNTVVTAGAFKTDHEYEHSHSTANRRTTNHRHLFITTTTMHSRQLDRIHRDQTSEHSFLLIGGITNTPAW